MGFQPHNRFVTVGLAIGEESCPVPLCGVQWKKTLQPVLLRFWPQRRKIIHDALTTIANWRGYGSVNHAGVFYGQKAHSLRAMIELPRRTAESFMLALGIHPAEEKDLQALSINGWRLIDPAHVASTPARYRRFIGASKAEFGIAKSGYVASRCGWFSDRSACYLASGRPVIAQDTGFSRFLPTGEGLWAYKTADEALGAIDSLNAGYSRHCRAARELAGDLFDSAKILPRLIESIGA